MELNKWEQKELNLFAENLPMFVQEDGLIDYRKMLIAKAELLLRYSQNRRKNFRKWTCDALGVGKNFLNQHQI